MAEGGFELVVVAPCVSATIRDLPHTEVIERTWEPADIDRRPFGLVFACTDDRAANADVGEAARARRIPVVVCDAPGESTFFTPATCREGAVCLAVSTGGAAPGLARELRDLLTPVVTRWMRENGGRIEEALRTRRSRHDNRVGRP
jgi:siroheme synthase-like protein